MTRTVKKWSAKDAAQCIITPSDLDHKYSRGVLGLITGSAQFPGAAVLTTAAASATGVGMVRFHSSSGLAHLVLHSTPSAVVQPGKVAAWVVGSGIDSARYIGYKMHGRRLWVAGNIYSCGCRHRGCNWQRSKASVLKRVRERGNEREKNELHRFYNIQS